jgi:O-antigen/teichoic acid export membrane protein
MTRSGDGTDEQRQARGTIREEELSTTDVRRRAVAGATIDVVRGFGVRFVGLIGTLVLARLLTPYDFGLVAFGATFVAFGIVVADGGIGTALIRRASPPERADLRALLAFQLGLTTIVALVVSLAVLPFGMIGQITAFMMAAIPLTAVRAPCVIVLERRLDYRPLAFVELVEAVCQQVVAIMLVIAGWGVWGLASANIARAVIGSAAMLLLVPEGRLLPFFSWERVRVLLGFGFRYQAVGVVHVLRDQGVNAVVALVAGVSALGLWSIAFRILQIPLLLLSSLWRVSFPSMSRLAAAGQDFTGTIGRVISVVAIAVGAILAPLVASSSPLVSVLLGDDWSGAAAVIPPYCLNLLIAGPISVALVGYLWAMGDAHAVLRSTLAGLPFLAVVLVLLLPVVGVAAVGFAWIAAGAAESVVLVRAARTRVRFSITPNLLPPVVAAVTAALLGWLAASAIKGPFLSAVGGASVAWFLYVVGLSVWQRHRLIDTIHLVSRGLRGAVIGR